MRILHITHGYWPRIGGMETLLYRLLAAQRAAGHEVRVLAERVPDSLPAVDEHAGVAIRRTSFPTALRNGAPDQVRAAVLEAAAWKREFRADVVHLHFFGTIPWLHLLTENAASAPSVVTLHVPLAHAGLPADLLRRVLESARAVVAVSEATLREWESLGGDWLARGSVVANGVPAPVLPRAPLPVSRPRLLCIGRMDPLKGFDVALRAMTGLRSRWPELKLIIAGDGGERPQLEKLARELGLAAAVEFRGWIAPDQVAALINEATLVVVPSRWQEPFGLVAVEAGLMGRPVIASRVGGLPGIVVDDVTGRLVPPEQPEALAEAIASCLQSPDALAIMGEAARERMLTRFTMDACAGQYAKLYTRISAGAGGGAPA